MYASVGEEGDKPAVATPRAYCRSRSKRTVTDVVLNF